MNHFPPVDLSLTVGSSEPFEGALLRVWAPGVGELAVLAPRQVLARKLNRRYVKLQGWFTVILPSDWELPAGQVTRFLVMLHGRGNAVIYCMAWGKAPVVRPYRQGLSVGLRIDFESHSPIFELPRNLDPDEVAGFEFPFLEDPSEIVGLIRYHDYLWEKARKWERFRMVQRALRRVAGRK